MNGLLAELDAPTGGGPARPLRRAGAMRGQPFRRHRTGWEIERTAPRDDRIGACGLRRIGLTVLWMAGSNSVL
jgi:hypothetical protein